MKTIILMASKPHHLYGVDIRLLPGSISNKAQFILIVNEHLYSQALSDFKEHYLEIFPVKVLPIKNPIQVEYNIDSLTPVIACIINRYSNLEFIVPDEYNLDRIEPILKSHNIKQWSQDTAKVCRDKVLMKNFMSENGIRVPKYRHLANSDNFEILSSEFGIPFIIKPTDSSGSIGVEKIQNSSQFANFIYQKNDVFTYEVEEFITGEMYHIDSVVIDSETISLMSQYTIPPNEIKTQPTIHGSIPLDEKEHHKEYHLLKQFNKQVLRALDNNGCYHLEVIINKNNEVVFIEIAWRQAGAPVNNNFTSYMGMTQTLFYIYSLIDNECLKKPQFNHDYFLVDYWVPRIRGTYQGLNLKNIKGTVSKIENITPIGEKCLDDFTSCNDISAKFTVEYKSLKVSYNDILDDFNVIKNLKLSI